MIRWIRLTIRTFRMRLDAACDKWRVWYEQRTCPHLFRAALIQKQPGRICKICDLAQPLSREDFYAEFGERYQAMLYTDAPVTVRRESHYVSIDTDSVQ